MGYDAWLRRLAWMTWATSAAAVARSVLTIATSGFRTVDRAGEASIGLLERQQLAWFVYAAPIEALTGDLTGDVDATMRPAQVSVGLRTPEARS